MMIAQLRRLILRAFPELGGRHVTRIGVVVAIADPPDAEKATDRFRPRYAVDVQLLTPGGQPDEGRPVLQGLPLPAFGAGDGRGFFAFPDVGTRVRVGYDYGLPSHPYIAAVLPEGRSLPALLPGELLIQQRDGALIRFTARGDLVIQTDGELREDSHVRSIEADDTTEIHGTLAHQVDGDWTQSVGGSLITEVLGVVKQTFGSDVRVAILGGLDQAIAGDKGELVGGKLELATGLDILIKSALGDILIESVTSTAELRAAMGATVDGTVSTDLLGAAINAGAGASQPVVLGGAFQTYFDTHTHLSAAPGNPSGPPVVLMSVTPGLLSGLVKISL